MLAGKKIILAVCGSIAAYKTAFFIRLLVRAGAEVKVIMTGSAKDFITPLTLSTLSKNPVYSGFFKNDNGEWHNHVALGMWADLMVIAPLSANTLAKLAHGHCDNLLTATYLSAKCPVMVAPAMDLDMYRHPATQENLRKLVSFGHLIVEAEEGELASGLHGIGRMAEPETLLEHVSRHFQQSTAFSGREVLITSGPTYESIDPVRFIGNHSTGKMGSALALEFAGRGATVHFVSGPVQHLPEHPSIRIYKVRSADEMFETARPLFSKAEIAVFTAAVADYKPAQAANRKIKKKEEDLTVTLVPNPDIAKELGKLKKKGQLTVGFALETDQEEVNAKEKLTKKNFDLIILNSLNNKGAGFAHDTNQVSIYDRDNNVKHFELKSKTEVAKDLVNEIEARINA